MKKQILFALLCGQAFAEDITPPQQIDDISVTATKMERATKDVSQSIAVVGKEQLENKNVFNITDAIDNIPGVQISSANGGYDAKLVIRGSGLKAAYGIREIMVLRDGVPMTDPDSFTRLDFIDVQDIERIEISKGPGSIYNANTSGGVVQIISKSVFDDYANRVKLGFGTQGKLNANIRYGFNLNDRDYFAFSLSRRHAKNKWRTHNEFDTTQFSLKYGHIFDNEATLESELAYTESNLEIPPSMNQAEYEEYLRTGQSKGIATPWQHSGRYSKIYFFNTRYKQDVGDFSFKPRFYLTKWEHVHPVTGMINVSEDNYIYGTDLEMNHKHKLFGKEGALVFGLTARQDISNNARKYQYADTRRNGRQMQTLSDRLGAYSGTEDATNTLYGFYVQESLNLSDKLLLDVGARLERLDMSMKGEQLTKYDYRSGRYVAGSGAYDISASYNLFSPKFGVTYRLNDNVNLYGSISRGVQAPTSSEVGANKSASQDNILGVAKSVNYEAGIKARSEKLFFDLGIYLNKTKDEITSRSVNNQTIYQNAGKTTKKGLETSIAYQINDLFSVDAAYAYSHYTYDDYVEGRENYSGNYFKFVPKHMYSLGVDFKHPQGFMVRVETKTWGKYFMDDANTEMYRGHRFVTNLMLGYQHKNHTFRLNANNIFDKKYANVAEKSGYSYTYKAAEPRSIMASYQYEF
ncbi:MAG: TonB-dependent receptor [Neisseria sp.]|nr:TonB-dependent receptor [Neisseria sp.]